MWNAAGHLDLDLSGLAKFVHSVLPLIRIGQVDRSARHRGLAASGNFTLIVSHVRHFAAEDASPWPFLFPIRQPQARDPVAHIRSSSDARLAGGQGAEAAEGIPSKPVVGFHDNANKFMTPCDSCLGNCKFGFRRIFVYLDVLLRIAADHPHRQWGIVCDDRARAPVDVIGVVDSAGDPPGADRARVPAAERAP